jgi:hypothetical protein
MEHLAFDGSIPMPATVAGGARYLESEGKVK